jgi:hypothetical protein
MANDTVDFAKIDTAFQQLAASDQGTRALAALAAALTDVTNVASGLNSAEAHYLLVNLVNQREQGPAVQHQPLSVSDARAVSGFKILTAVPAENALFATRVSR